METVVLRSELDPSTNFVSEGSFPGKIEARYVRRRDDYFICYLSSQTGCRKACRMCHLTQTGQTDAVDVGLEQFFRQADQVLAHYDRYDRESRPAKMIHYNFMARGEVLSNDTVLTRGAELLAGLAERATVRGLIPKFKLSTIMPQEMADFDLASLFSPYNPDIYYSLYSVEQEFRRRWLPKALPYQTALEKLVAYQQVTRKIPVIHFAFIEGENDSAEAVEALCDEINGAGLRVDINIVAYNPYSDKQGREPEEPVLLRNAEIMQSLLPGARIKFVDRVGFDVKASCGMFVR